MTISISFETWRAHRRKLQIVLPYLVVGALWIYTSDRIIGGLNFSPRLLGWWSTLKGFGFLAVTGMLLWLRLARLLNELDATADNLRQSEAGYQDLYENAPDMYLSVDVVTGQVRQCNQALVVDDEDAIRAAGQRVLNGLGYRVLLARNGAEGIVKYSKRGREIQAVITDISMPVMDVASLIRVLRQLAPGVPILAMSGLPAAVDEATSTGLPVNAFPTKPFSLAQLIAALHHVSSSHATHPTP
jgi:CheY-like chemotaxis protein